MDGNIEVENLINSFGKKWHAIHFHLETLHLFGIVFQLEPAHCEGVITANLLFNPNFQGEKTAQNAKKPLKHIGKRGLSKKS
jgi:hypothetical protein